MPRPKKLPEGMILRGKTYHSCFRFKGRLVRKRLSNDLGTATSMLRDLRGRMERGDWGLLDNDAPWKEVKAQFLSHAKQTLRNYEQVERAILRFEKFRPVTNIKHIDHAYVVGYRAWRMSQPVAKGRRQISPRTINLDTSILSTMLTKAVTWGIIGSNPIAKLKPLRNDSPAKQRRSLTASEVQELFRVTPEYLRNVWRFFMVTGMRLNEVAGLTWDDIDFERKSVIVTADRAKSRKEREIPLDDEMIKTLVSLREAAPFREMFTSKNAKMTQQLENNFSKDHVFVTAKNTVWSNNLLTRFYTYCRKAGITDAGGRGAIDIHSLRVTFATLCIENGASPKAVQDILGHSTLNMTMGIYAKATDRAKRAAVSCLPFAAASAPDHVLKMVKDEQASAHTEFTSKAVGAENTVKNKREEGERATIRLTLFPVDETLARSSTNTLKIETVTLAKTQKVNKGHAIM